MDGNFDELLKTFEEYTEARGLGDERKADELKGALRASLSAFVVGAVAEDLRGNGALVRMSDWHARLLRGLRAGGYIRQRRRVCRYSRPGRQE